MLLEPRPALDYYAGIPQQTRLLFRGLALLEELKVEGLIQSSTHALRSASGQSRGTQTDQGQDLSGVEAMMSGGAVVAPISPHIVRSTPTPPSTATRIPWTM